MVADGQLGYHLTLCLLRSLAVPCPRPRAHRRAIQYLDRDGNGFLLCSLILSKVRPWYSLARPSANTRDRCQRTMFVARDEHEEAKIVACPLPDCDHAWCKQCQQSIDRNGPKHSCDGTSELDHLMKQQGWKYCPSEPELTTFVLLGSQFFLFFSMQDAHPENIGMQSHVCT